MRTHLVRFVVALACLGIWVTEAAAEAATRAAAGYYHTCALTAGGGVACWGFNNDGQLGDGTRTDRLTPTMVSGLGSGIAALAAGASHTCALTTGGGVVCWGRNADGQLGNGGSGVDSRSLTPTAVVGFAGRPAFLDFTGDVKSDILWRHSTQGDLWLWPMDGAAKVSETYVRTVADTNWEIRGQGDMNGDGTADILWRNKVSGEIYFWPMNGPVPIDGIHVGTVDTAYDIVGTGDFNGDGESDILWRNIA